MTARQLDPTRVLFVSAAAYDALLGGVFLVAPMWPFHRFGVPEPNHPAYVQFPGALLIIFGLMFLTVARDPPRYRHLIGFGILLKLAYCGLAFAYWATRGAPGMFKVFAVIDLVMGVLFVWAYLGLTPTPAADTPARL